MALEITEKLLTSRERTSLKIKLLDVIDNYDGPRIKKIIHKIWKSTPARIGKKIALEIFLKHEPDEALRFILDYGITDKRIGVRAATYEILGRIKENPSTHALLEGLKKDESKWVRIQAFNSLISPGRSINIDEIKNACQDETDPEVLETCKDYLQ